MIKIIARLMWLLPALLIVIAVLLTKAGLNQRQTLAEGVPAIAQVKKVVLRNRSEITYGSLDLEVDLPDGTHFSKTISLPLSLLNGVKDEKELPVRVRVGSDQPILVESFARAQWRMSLIHAMMAGMGAIILIIGVRGWNRYLNQKGDPGQQDTATLDETT